jgi:hypothetical protein
MRGALNEPATNRDDDTALAPLLSLIAVYT